MRTSQNKLYQLQGERFDELVYDSQIRIHKFGKVVYVDSNTGSSSPSNGGVTIRSPFSTLSAAMSACTASQGDSIIILPQHSETVTSTITIKAGVRVQGLTLGNLRPTITINGATDLFSMSGANASLSGLDLAITTTDAATAFIDVSAARCRIFDIKMIPSATSVNVEDCITLASGANDCLIENVRIFNTTVAVNSFLSIEAAVARLRLKDCFFFGDVATAGIIDSATATQMFWDRVTVAVVGTTKPAATLDSNPTGLIQNSYFSGTSTTLATNFNPGNALRLMNVLVLEETDASKQGAPIPAVDAD